MNENKDYFVTEKEIIEIKKRRYVRRMLHQAVARGDLKRPENCELCKKKSKINAHHTDYGQPLSVTWLCSKCHTTVHNQATHPLNPCNSKQTPLPHIVQIQNRVCVMFDLPIANFLALKKAATEKKIKVAQLLRDITIKNFPVKSNQLEFNFEDKKNEKESKRKICVTPTNKHPDLSRMAPYTIMVTKPERPQFSKIWQEKCQIRPRMGGIFEFCYGYGRNSGLMHGHSTDR